MATTSKYITRNDLSVYSKSILSLLAQRDTKINTNTNDIDALKLAIANIDTSLHYMGDVQTLPTTAEDGALYQVAGSTSTAVNDGWYFYSVDSTAWKNLSTGISAKEAKEYIDNKIVYSSTEPTDAQEGSEWTLPY